MSHKQLRHFKPGKAIRRYQRMRALHFRWYVVSYAWWYRHHPNAGRGVQYDHSVDAIRYAAAAGQLINGVQP